MNLKTNPNKYENESKIKLWKEDSNKKKKKTVEKEIKNNYLEPQQFTCFHCQKPFKVKYNRGIGMPSQMNYWLYWISEDWNYKQMRRKPEAERGDKICSESLRNIFLNKEWELLDQIKSKRKRMISHYLYHKMI